MQGAQKANREAYYTYVERFGLQRNAADEPFSTDDDSLLLKLVNHARHIPRPETIVDINHADTSGAAVEHGQKGSNSLENGAIAHTGRHGDRLYAIYGSGSRLGLLV